MGKLEYAAASDVRAWQWNGDETLHPFWVVERVTEEERKKAQRGVFNLTLEEKELLAVTVGASSGGSLSVTFTVVIPIMTNTVDVKKGGGVVVANQPQEGDEAEGRVVENRRGQGRESSEGQSESEDGGQ